MASCGACNLCCTLLGVPDIKKPARVRCWWTTVHGGCSRQSEKGTTPELDACAEFQCLWLASQSQPDPNLILSRSMRPDMCHVVIGPDVTVDGVRTVNVQVDPKFPQAWKEPQIASYLARMVEVGPVIKIIIGDEVVVLEPNRATTV
jgi:uncharacterized protein